MASPKIALKSQVDALAAAGSTDAEVAASVAAAVATLTTALNAKQDQSSAATDAEVATVNAALTAAIAGVQVAVDASVAAGATDVELAAAVAAAVATLNTAIGLKLNASEKATASGVASLSASSRVVQSPKLHATDHQPGGTDALAIDTAAATGSLRTLGTGSAQAAQGSVAEAHRVDTANPHAVTKAQVGLGSADNTADTAKPVSTAQQAAINGARQTLAGTLYAQGQPPTFPAGRILVGSHSNLVSQGSESPSLAFREAQLGRTFDIGSHFYSWSDTGLPGAWEADDIAHGRIPLVGWLGTALAPVIAGTHDAYITIVANNCKAFGWPMFIRWGWEMNGDWYAWSGPSNGADPRLWVKAYQRIWGIFKALGVTNVSWVWCPNPSSKPGGTTLTDANNWRYYYPGDQYVDVIGTDPYNWGDFDVAGHGSWQGMSSACGAFLTDWQGGFAGRMETVKPMMICEWGCNPTPGNKPQWITDGMGFLRQQGVSAIVGFDTDSGSQWTWENPAAALTAVKELAGRPDCGGKTTGGSTYRDTVMADLPFGYWPLNELAAPFADLGSGAAPATLEAGHAVIRTKGPLPRPGLKSGVSTGSGMVSLGLLPTFGPAMGSGFTVELLVKYGSQVTAPSVPQAIIGELNTTGTGLLMLMHSDSALSFSLNSTLFWVRNEAAVARSARFTALPIYDGLWHHVVWVCNPAVTTDVFYLDGAVVTPTSQTGSASGGTFAEFGNPVTLGERSKTSSVYDFQAQISAGHLALYKTKLAAGRVTEHYAALTA